MGGFLRDVLDFVTVAASFLWGMPIVILTVLVAVVLTVKTKAFQFRYFGHAFKHTLGNITNKGTEKTGISPFRACCAALASTIGTGNIVGVAVAITTGGPGALFWMWMVALFGMIVKYGEIVVAIKYREKDPLTGGYMGGMPQVAKNGLTKRWAWLGTAWAFMNLISMAYGVSVHSNGITTSVITAFDISPVLIGVVLVIITGIVVYGGFKRISAFAQMAVPFMALLYCGVGIYVIVMNASAVPGVLAMVLKCAFTGHAAVGGFLGASVAKALSTGMARGVFSNEAGTGFGSISHSNADVDHPVKQGLWGIVEVFVDTIVVCTMTGLVILVSGAWTGDVTSSALTAVAFSTGMGGNLKAATVFITVVLFLFAFTTIVVNIYYGEVSLARFINTKSTKNLYRLIGLFFVFIGCIGAVTDLYAVNDFIAAFLNIFCLTILFLKRKDIWELTQDYIEKYGKSKK